MGAFHNPAVELYSPPQWMPISHLAAVAATGDIESVACCDVSETAANAAREKFKLPAAYTDVGKMLECEKIDVLTIATRTPGKAEIICKAINAGVRAIHVEKPLCNSAEELVAIKESVERNGIFLTYGCIRRYMPAYRSVRDRVLKAEFGEIQDIAVDMGRAPLMWTQVHAIDQILLFGAPHRPIKVQAWLDNVIIGRHANHVLSDPTILSATILFDNGLVGRIGCASGLGTSISSAVSRLEIYADGWQAFESVAKQNDIYQIRREIPTAQAIFPGGSAYPISLLVRALKGEGEALVNVANSQTAVFTSQSCLLSMLHSHLNGGKWVDIDSYAPQLTIDGLTDGRSA